MAVSEIAVNILANTSKFTAGMKKVSKSLDRTQRRLDNFTSKVTALALPIGVATGASIKAFADFDKAMVESTAIMGNLTDAMRSDMVDAAKKVAKSTTFSAKESAESYFFLASAGLDAAQSIGALPKVAEFAQAGAFNMATATDLLTDAQSALGLTVDNTAKNIENMTRVSDVLVKANTIANASVQQFSEALTNKAGSALKIVNKDLEEGVAVLAAFADQGIKGLDAGTKFGIVMRDLQTKALANKKAFEELGITVFDQNGMMTNLGEIVGQLENALDGMSDSTKKATLLQLGFTDKSVSAIQTLLGMSETIKKYEADLRNAGGTTQDVADKQLTSLSNQLKILKDNLEIAALEFGESFKPEVESVAGFIRDLTERFRNLDPETKTLLKNLSIAAVSIPVVTKALALLAGALVALTNPIGAVAIAVTAAVAVIADDMGVSLQDMKGALKLFIDDFKSLWNSAVDFVSDINDKLVPNKEYKRKLDERKKAEAKFHKDVEDLLRTAITKGKSFVKEKVELAREEFKGVKGWLDKLEGAKVQAALAEQKRKEQQAKNAKHLKEVNKALSELREEYKLTALEINKRSIEKQLEEAAKKLDRASFEKLKKKYQEAIHEGVLAGHQDYVKLGSDAVTKELANKSAQVFEQEMPRFEDVFKEASEKGTKKGLENIQKLSVSLFEDFSSADFSQGLGKGISDAFNNINSDVFDDIVKVFKKDLKEVFGDISDSELSAELQSISSAAGTVIDSLSTVGKSTADTISAVTTTAGTAIGSIWGPAGAAVGAQLGSLVGEAFSGFGSDGDSQSKARDEIEKWLENVFNDDLAFGARGRFEELGFADVFKNIAGEGFTAFNSLGEALVSFLGVTEDIGGQVGFILAENLGGSVNKLRLLINSLPVSVEQLGDSLIQAGERGVKSWHEVITAVQGLEGAAGQGLVEVGNLRGAFDLLIETGGRGAQAIEAVRAVAIEAMERGAQSLSDLESDLRSSGEFTESEITALMGALSQRGIESLQELSEAGTRKLGEIVADMESLGFAFQDVGTSIFEAAEKVESFTEFLNNVPPKVETKFVIDVDVRGDEIPDATGININGVQENARGAILNKRTFVGISNGLAQIAGEAGPEAILPLKRIGGKLGVIAESNGDKGGDVFNINVDARGAQAGVAEQIRRELENVFDKHNRGPGGMF